MSYFEKLDIFYSFELLYFYYFWKIKLHSWISLDAYGLLIFHTKLKIFELNFVWRVRPFEYLIKNLLLLLLLLLLFLKINPAWRIRSFGNLIKSFLKLYFFKKK